MQTSTKKELKITGTIQQLLESGATVHAEEVRGYWRDTGNASDLLDANRLVLSRLRYDVQGTVEDSELVGEIVIAAGAIVRRSRIRGPVSIAAHAIIEDSYVSPYTSIGEGAIVRHAELEYSIQMQGARLEGVEKRLYSSILGEEAKVISEVQQRNTVQFFLGDRSVIKL
jgi:glucose-1-phosphate thymidylyltransferase